MEILAIIPARSGSKGLSHKNIRMINGKPMIAYSIEHALVSKLITRVIVSSDSERYLEIARNYGAETPFIRPAEFAGDESLDIDVFHHALSWLRDNEGYIPDICVQLRPCCAMRDPAVVDEIIQKLIDNPEWDSIRSVALSTELPYKMWNLSGEQTLTPIVKDPPECYNMLRQSLPSAYYQNGYVDAFRPRAVLEQKSMTGSRIGGFIVNEYFDVDYLDDLLLVDACLKIRNQKKSFLFDCDGILLDADKTVIHDNVNLLGKLRLLGHAVYVRCSEEDAGRKLAALGCPEVDGVVAGFMETDYYISAKSLQLADLRKIIVKDVRNEKLD